MAQVTLSQYIESLKRALANHDSDAAADLLSFRHSHASNQRLQVREPEQRCQEAFEQPWDELVAAHLRCIWAAGNRNFVEAYSCQALAVQAFTKAFQNMKDDNWALPIMFVLCLDLRLFAGSAEVEKAKKMHGVETGELLEKAADLIMGCFRVCASDSRAAIEVSKKWGMLNLVNQLFKIYFKINKLHLCKPLVRAIDSLQYKDEFSLAQTVTYRYYVGRKFMFDSDYKSAEKELTFAFERCHRQSKTNKRLILISLLPVKMLLGYLPSADVLKRYDLEQFGEVATAVRRGDLSGLNQVLQKYETFFIRCGIYLILEKLKVITYRNLFKKIYLLTKVHQLKVSLFVAALRWMNVDDIDADEAECIIANLIYEPQSNITTTNDTATSES